MTTTVTTAPGGRKITAAVDAGTTTAAIFVGAQTAVAAIPGGGGTMLVEASFSTVAAVEGGTANWLSWDAGTVSSKTAQLLLNATAVRFTATTAAGVGEISL